MRIYIEASDFSLFESMIFYGKLDCTWVKVNPPRSRVPVGKRIYIYIYIFHGISLHMVQLKFPVETGKLGETFATLSRVSSNTREPPTFGWFWIRAANVCQIASTPQFSYNFMAMDRRVDPMFHGILFDLLFGPESSNNRTDIESNISIEKIVHFFLETAWILRTAKKRNCLEKLCIKLWQVWRNQRTDEKKKLP